MAGFKVGRINSCDCGM